MTLLGDVQPHLSLPTTGQPCLPAPVVSSPRPQPPYQVEYLLACWLCALQPSMLLLMKPQKHPHASQEFQVPTERRDEEKELLKDNLSASDSQLSFLVSVFYLTRDGCRDGRSWNIWGNRIGLSSPCNKHSWKFLTQIASWLQI